MDDRNVGSLFYEIEVYDKNGKLIDKKRGKGDSILSNWINLFIAIRGGYSYDFKNTNGQDVSIDTLSFVNSSMKAPAGDDTFGIVVGTATDTVTMADFNLYGKISHGTGSGQLSYGETSEYNDASGMQWDRGLQRSFDNNSGADITINEIGLVMMISDGSVNYFVMIARDVISATTVPNGGRVTIKYWFRWNPSS